MRTRTTEAFNSRLLVLAVCFSLVGMTWFVFGQTRTYPFINFDDPEYVYEEPQITGGLTANGIAWAFTHFPSVNWYPLSLVSHMMDCQFYGLNAGGHHVTNVLLHTIAALLLFFALRNMTGAIWRSAFVAAIFAIHPLRVESVAWISERKDVLSGFLFMLVLGAYARYARQPSTGRYIIMSILFVCGLLSKQMLVTLPIVLLLLDYWPLKRMADLRAVGRMILEKIPLLTLSAASAFATFLAQRNATGLVTQISLPWRIGNAIVSYVTYIWQMIWPVDLAVFYPHPEDHLPIWQIALAAAFLITVTTATIAWRKSYPYFLVGWLWYLSMLAPVIGIVEINRQGHADRYTYLPQIGLYLALIWGIAKLSARWRCRRALLSATSIIVIVAFATAARAQVSYWRDSEVLWNHALAVTSGNDTAHAHLADLLLRRGRIDEAIEQCEEALRIRPNNADANNNLGLAFFRSGKLRDATAHWRKSLEIDPNDSNAQSNLAWSLATSPDASLRDGAAALELATNAVNRTAHPNAIMLRTLAAAYAEGRQFPEAKATALEALRLAESLNNSALAADIRLNIDNYRRNLPLRDPGTTSAP